MSPARPLARMSEFGEASGVIRIQFISIVAYGLIAWWYVAPWLKKLSKRQALTAPLWIHVFRYVSLYLPVARHEGYAISSNVLTVVVIGDLSGAMLAIMGIILLRTRSRLGPVITGLVIIASIIDFAVGTYFRAIEPATVEATGVWWLIFVFFAPLVIISLPLIAWQLYARRGEPLSEEDPLISAQNS